MEGAPDPTLGHEGSTADARCVLDHHPDPCDYIDKKGKKCTEYGEFDPDWEPQNNTGTRQKSDTVPDAGKVANDKQPDALADLSAKNEKMEANLMKVQDSVGQLTDDMANLMKMMATLTKSSPDPAARPPSESLIILSIFQSEQKEGASPLHYTHYRRSRSKLHPLHHLHYHPPA